jgi:hypothetical protein
VFRVGVTRKVTFLKCLSGNLIEGGEGPYKRSQEMRDLVTEDQVARATAFDFVSILPKLYELVRGLKMGPNNKTFL